MREPSVELGNGVGRVEVGPGKFALCELFRLTMGLGACWSDLGCFSS